MPPKAPRRVRSRRASFVFDQQKIVDRVLKFFEQDDTDRGAEKDARLQRYAKYRMWTEGSDYPWPDSSDIGLSDIMEKGLRMDDTLHNAVMSSRPVITATAVEERDKPRQGAIDSLLDYQVFVEQNGEDIIGDLANAFTTDGEFIAFVPWVKERREVSDSKEFDPIPPESLPAEYFATLIQKSFGKPGAVTVKGDGWDWRIAGDDGPLDVAFYVAEEGGPVEMTVKREVVVYDGPRIIQKEWDQVLYPARAANLHIPGPSNPHGAGHVILVDHPSVDEVRRLARDGIYDRLDAESMEMIDNTAMSDKNQEMEDQKDAFQGTNKPVSAQETGKKKPQKTVTRLMCFDLYDAREDGKTEDMVWTVILETKSLAQARLMTEVYPGRVPRRPLIHKSLIPVRGRVSGISLPEMLEGLHDAMKAGLDMTVDAGTIKLMPPGFYRPFGTLKPETLYYGPGELIPLGDPQRDINFPTTNTQAETMALNLFSLLGQMEERLSVIGDLQLGRVPAGKASALRTVGGMAMIAGQGEARPERILRRFFGGLAEIWRQIYELDRFFMPEKKLVRVVGAKKQGERPFLEVTREDIEQGYIFDFKANVLNTSKEAMQQAIEQIMSVGVSEIAVQLGIVDGGGIYRMFRDHAKAYGQDPDQYYNEPNPGAMKQRIMAEEAVNMIIAGQIPDGVPAEGGGAAEHLAKLQAFMDPNQDLIAGKDVDFDEFGLLDTPEKVDMFKGYIQQIAESAAFEQRQSQLLQAAGSFGNGQGGGQGGRPPEGGQQDPNEPTVLGPGELADESLPGAGGGANPGIGLAG